jgi:hypothetical protein
MSSQASLSPSFHSGGAVRAWRSIVLPAPRFNPVILAKISAILLITKVLPYHLDLLQALALFS